MVGRKQRAHGESLTVTGRKATITVVRIMTRMRELLITSSWSESSVTPGPFGAAQLRLLPVAASPGSSRPGRILSQREIASGVTNRRDTLFGTEAQHERTGAALPLAWVTGTAAPTSQVRSRTAAPNPTRSNFPSPSTTQPPAPLHSLSLSLKLSLSPFLRIRVTFRPFPPPGPSGSPPRARSPGLY